MNCVSLFVTPWTVAHQAPPAIGFPRQEYWNGLLYSFPKDLPNPGIKPASLALAGRFLIAEEGFLISPCYSLEFCIHTGISFLFSFAFSFLSLLSYL